MTNIFENAYFGKAYKTRDGRKAIYLGYTNNSIYHICFIEDESNKTFHFNNGDAWGHQRKGNNVDDIVSEWHEEINEEELDELANEDFENDRFTNIPQIIHYYKLGFTVGYRKAMEK